MYFKTLNQHTSHYRMTMTRSKKAAWCKTKMNIKSDVCGLLQWENTNMTVNREGTVT